MSIYENDSGGPQVATGNGWYYTYHAESESWVSEDACEAYLRGRFSMEPVEE